MYLPQPFAVTDKEKILAFIKSNTFGQLISTVNGRLFSSHIPFVVTDDGRSLICHLARHNPQWEDLVGQEVLVTFQGPHGYVSPSWYSSPGVPTWNYQAVNFYGSPEIITDEEKLKAMLEQLTEFYESAFDKPWASDYKASLLSGIIGVQVRMEEVHCKYKLSQNRCEQDRLQVVEELESRGSVKLARAMKDAL